jgi:hypothetical protein
VSSFYEVTVATAGDAGWPQSYDPTRPVVGVTRWCGKHHARRARRRRGIRGGGAAGFFCGGEIGPVGG